MMRSKRSPRPVGSANPRIRSLQIAGSGAVANLRAEMVAQLRRFDQPHRDQTVKSHPKATPVRKALVRLGELADSKEALTRLVECNPQSLPLPAPCTVECTFGALTSGYFLQISISPNS